MPACPVGAIGASYDPTLPQAHIALCTSQVRLALEVTEILRLHSGSQIDASLDSSAVSWCMQS